MILYQVILALMVVTMTKFGDAIAIKGIQGGVNANTGERPVRKEFSAFRSSGPAFDLYILALQQFQQQNQTAPLSYFQIAGIHGLPYRAWDGVSGNYTTGYCTHASILFPPWHRPYLALFEQILWNNAQQIAATYPVTQRVQYQQAANTFRIPYWDWSITPTMPPEVNQPVITINGPLGSRNINNPLYNYTFRPQPSATEFPPSSSLALFHGTVRYPNSAGQSQPDLVNKQLQANGASLHSSTYQLITQQSIYAAFSNTGSNDSRGNRYNSIENMHNAIHSLVGNGGHMAVVPYSAFDPIFWLHHTNVDRLFAIWQAIYPSSFVTSQISFYGTYTNTPGKSEDINTPLTPFHSDDAGALHTSVTARSTRSFGYTYPEIVDWGVNATQLTANVKARLNALYNPSSSVERRSTMSSRGSNRGSNRGNGARRFPNGRNRQWFINIRVDKSTVTSSFFVHFFLGLVSVDPTGWSFAPNLVGTHSVLDATIVTATNTGPATTLYGQIPLNHALLDSGIHSLAPKSVVPFLKSQLSWRLQRMDDSPLDVSEVPSLKIYVVGQRVRPRAADDAFPKYEKLVAYRSVTRGKAGGLADADPE